MSDPLDDSTPALDELGDEELDSIEPPTPQPVKRSPRPKPLTRPKPITARATVNLSGLRAGQTATVDPGQQYIRDLLDSGYLVEVADDDEA